VEVIIYTDAKYTVISTLSIPPRECTILHLNNASISHSRVLNRF